MRFAGIAEVRKVLDDVLDGFVSEAAARERYGVEVRSHELDAAATKRRRSDMARARTSAGLFAFGEERSAYEEGWTDDVWQHYSRTLYGLPVSVRAEARLRLWTALEEQRLAGKRLTPDAVDQTWQQVGTPLVAADQDT